jgi:hypothetical protein
MLADWVSFVANTVHVLKDDSLWSTPEYRHAARIACVNGYEATVCVTHSLYIDAGTSIVSTEVSSCSNIFCVGSRR